MLYVALTELLLIASLVWLNSRERATHDRAILDLISAQDAERQLLLDRIEQPGAVVAPSRLMKQPDPPPDETELLRRAYESETPNGS